MVSAAGTLPFVVSSLFKQPGDVLRIEMKTARWLGDAAITGVTASTVAEQIDPATPCAPNYARTPLVSAVSTQPGSLSLMLSGGVSGFVYTITIALRTSDGRSREHEMLLAVQEIP